MKAIFAVSALAAAIASAPAFAADTEATTTFKGSMDARFVLDLAADPVTYDVDLNDDDDFLYGIGVEWAVKNGPFSGSIGLEADEDSTPAITVGDLVVTDGKLSFGQVGNLMSTDQYADGGDEMAEEGTLDTDVAFRYMVAEGLHVQLGGEENDAGTAIKPAVKYEGSAGDLSFVAEGEFSASGPGADADLDPEFFAGAGVTYKTDMVTVRAAVNSFANYNATNTVKTERTEYAADVTAKVAGATIVAGYVELDVDADDTEIAKVEVSYAIDAITPSAGYKFTTAEKTGDEIWGKVAYAQDNLEASVMAKIANFDADEADDLLIETRVSTKSEAGVTYYAEHDLQGDATNKLSLGAKYSF